MVCFSFQHLVWPSRLTRSHSLLTSLVLDHSSACSAVRSLAAPHRHTTHPPALSAASRALLRRTRLEIQLPAPLLAVSSDPFRSLVACLATPCYPVVSLSFLR